LSSKSKIDFAIHYSHPDTQVKKLVSIVLNVCLGVFLAEGAVALVDDSVIVLFGVHGFDFIRGLLFLLVLAATGVTYLLMGLTPTVRKRLFLPIVLFNPIAACAAIPLSIYYSSHIEQIAWVISIGQVLLGWSVFYAIRRGATAAWPLVPEEKLEEGPFSWGRLISFLAVNIFLVAPSVLVYVLFCTSLAVDHFSGGFLAFHPGSLVVRTRTYVRADGKTIQLVPMMHIGENDFYRRVSQSMLTNSVVLLEGVTDRRHLLHEKLSYSRMAKSLGLVEQRESFAPGPASVRPADVDVEQFSATTLEFLNAAIQLHARGLTLETLQKLFETSDSPEATEQLWKDILTGRNEHLLTEIENELKHSNYLVVPWGAAHMPGLARGIQQTGFRLRSSEEFPVVRFASVWKGLREPASAPQKRNEGGLGQDGKN
jgi:hypothetical protein